MGRGPSIEGRKNAIDAKRGKIFTKIIREIGVAARAGGGDRGQQPRLRTAIDKGLSANMSKDVIERAIKKATGELEGVEYEEIRYEGYAPGGVAVIVDCLTDNRVRTVADVRHAFGKFGGNMGTEGSVAFMFHKLGVLSFAAGADEDAITEAAIEAGADDVVVYPEDGADRRADRAGRVPGGQGGDGSRGPGARPCGGHHARRQRRRRRGRHRAAGGQAAGHGWRTWTTCRTSIPTPTSDARTPTPERRSDLLHR